MLHAASKKIIPINNYNNEEEQSKSMKRFYLNLMIVHLRCVWDSTLWDSTLRIVLSDRWEIQIVCQFKRVIVVSPDPSIQLKKKVMFI